MSTAKTRHPVKVTVLMQSASFSLRLFICAFALSVILIGTVAISRADSSSDIGKARAALAKYQDPFTAVRDGYFSTVACVQFTTAGMLNGMPYPAGAMGVHFVNFSLLGKLDPTQPQVLLYEPLPNGKLQLAGAEWFVPYTKGMKPPKLFGQTFYGPMMGHYPVMPSQMVHYDLHAWLWLKNPAGMFMPTNAALKCPSGPYTFTDKTPITPGMKGS